MTLSPPDPIPAPVNRFGTRAPVNPFGTPAPVGAAPINRFGPPAPGTGLSGYPGSVAVYPPPPPGTHAMTFSGYRDPGTNRYAIAGLVFGVIGGGLLSVIFSLHALRQIKVSGARGRGMALAGLVLSGVWVVVLTISAVISVTSSAHRDSTGAVTQQGQASVTSLRVGDCLIDWASGTTVTSLTLTACSTAHHAEVYAQVDIAARGSAYPGAAAVRTDAEAICNNAADALDHNLVPQDALLAWLQPLAANWADGDHRVTCIVHTPEPVTGTLRSTPRAA